MLEWGGISYSRLSAQVPANIDCRGGERSANVQPPSVPQFILTERSMTLRIRHCVECPNCFTRYVIGFSPYRNGAHVISHPAGGSEEHTLYCSCGTRSSSIRWSDLKTCTVSTQAHDRGFGPPDEVVLVKH